MVCLVVLGDYQCVVAVVGHSCLSIASCAFVYECECAVRVRIHRIEGRWGRTPTDTDGIKVYAEIGNPAYTHALVAVATEGDYQGDKIGHLPDIVALALSPLFADELVNIHVRWGMSSSFGCLQFLDTSHESCRYRVI